jgi:hypothetical protein
VAWRPADRRWRAESGAALIFHQHVSYMLVSLVEKTRDFRPAVAAMVQGSDLI